MKSHDFAPGINRGMTPIKEFLYTIHNIDLSPAAIRRQVIGQANISWEDVYDFQDRIIIHDRSGSWAFDFDEVQPNTGKFLCPANAKAWILSKEMVMSACQYPKDIDTRWDRFLQPSTAIAYVRQMKNLYWPIGRINDHSCFYVPGQEHGPQWQYNYELARIILGQQPQTELEMT